MSASIRNPPKAIGRARLPLLFGVATALIVVVTAWLTQLQSEREAWVRHTLEVEQALSDLSTSVYRAEAFERGFLLTGQANYAQVYDRERASIPGQVAGLEALTADNPQQRAQIRSLREAVQRKLEETDGAIALRRAGAVDAAMAGLKDGSTRAFSVDIIRIVGRMRAEEARLLARRTRQTQGLNLTLLCAVAASGLLVMGFAALWL